MPCIKSDAHWAQSWMAAQRGLPPGVESDASWVPSWMTLHIRARHVWRNSYPVFSITKGSPSQAPTPSAALLHPATVHVFKSSPMPGRRLQIKLKSLHWGVVVRDLKGRERAVGGDAESPLGLQKCSRARQGGWGERHCLLNTGYRGVDVTFVNVHRRLYRTHPGRTG